jgi:dihydrodipicolinate synthase/N-acetylneuraminate lyase
MPALITPFTARGEIDLEAHAHNICWMADHGIRGLLVGGSTGEGPYLEPGERTALVSAAREAAPGAFVLCGVAAESLRMAQSQAAEAVEGGADAVLALSPTSLVRGVDDLVRRYFTDLADRADLPVFLYTVPRVTGYELPVPAIAELAQHPNIAGIKDSGGQPVRVAAMRQSVPEDFLVYVGATVALTLSVAAGGTGGITASTNYLPELALEVIRKAVRSPRSAAAAQARLTDLATTVEAGRIPAIKVAAGLRGLRPGTVRRPLRPAGRSAARKVEETLREAGLL